MSLPHLPGDRAWSTGQAQHSWGSSFHHHPCPLWMQRGTSEGWWRKSHSSCGDAPCLVWASLKQGRVPESCHQGAMMTCGWGGADEAPISHLGLPLPQRGLLPAAQQTVEEEGRPQLTPRMPCHGQASHWSERAVSEGVSPANPMQTEAWGEGVPTPCHPRVRYWLQPGLYPGRGDAGT